MWQKELFFSVGWATQPSWWARSCTVDIERLVHSLVFYYNIEHTQHYYHPKIPENSQYITAPTSSSLDLLLEDGDPPIQRKHYVVF
jgi:hypothetical protein